MQQVDVEELREGALYLIWKLREMQQIGAPLIILVGYIPQQPPEKKKKLVDETVADPRTSKELEKQGDDLCDSRSLVLASLMINEIDARDEQFIASVQAEIEHQEIIARHL
ncbi:hypothetical protein Gorai_018748 [Gossypium raimondii]|uniref:Uncharacterized protein n=1 Tax=Gossypium raimondii TaxID=29730 RepID=A0A7J8PL68_GOSRA|nr:hypothetical protein [Gossypium raimondii]